MNKFPISNFQFPIAIFAISLGLLFCHPAAASMLYAGSAQELVHEGQTIEINWFLDSQNRSINAVDLEIGFSTNTLKLVETGAGNSVVSLWVMLPTENGEGQIKLIGGIPAGVQGQELPIFKTLFLAKKSGVGEIFLKPASKVLLNDGNGTPDALSFKQIKFNISSASLAPAVVASPTHPDQSYWYKNNNVTVALSPKPGEEYSYSFSSNLDITPEDKTVSLPKEISYNNLPDGIYYFKLDSKTGMNPWKELEIYRIQIDQTQPEDFVPLIGSDPAIFGGKPFLSFSAVDKTSGIDHYEIKQGLFGKFSKAEMPYLLKTPLVGDKLVVKAVDRAGNIREVQLTHKGYIPQIVFWAALTILLICGLVVLYIYKLRRRKK